MFQGAYQASLFQMVTLDDLGEVSLWDFLVGVIRLFKVAVLLIYAN